MAQGKGLAAQTAAGGTVTIPQDGVQGVVLRSPDGGAVRVRLPVDSTDAAATIVGRSAVYEGVALASDVVAQATPEGVRALVVARNQSAPTRFRFRFDLPKSGALVPTADGGLDIVVSQGNVPARIGRVEPPWAKDAHGAAIPNGIAATSCGVYVYDAFTGVSNTFKNAARLNRCVEMQYLCSGVLVGWNTKKCWGKEESCGGPLWRQPRSG